MENDISNPPNPLKYGKFYTFFEGFPFTKKDYVDHLHCKIMVLNFNFDPALT